MREILEDLETWRRSGTAAAVARVVDLEGSGPRDPGAAMAVNEDGQVIGSVSGGCVEGAVVVEALEIIESGERRMVTFGFSDDEAFAVGLTCGGTIHLFIEAFDGNDEVLVKLEALIDAERPVALATVIEGPNTGHKLLVAPDSDPVGTLGNADLDRVVGRDMAGELAAGQTGVRHYGEEGEARESVVSVFIESFAPPPQMLVFGAVDFTAALVRIAKVLGYRVTVCDARPVFATPQRFPSADEVAVKWPNDLLDEVGSTLGPRDVVCVLTHDNKFDVPAITGALRTDVGYIGVMGSRKTHESRRLRLVEAGVTAEQFARLLSPVGLDIGARTPEETAVSICAEIIALRTGRDAPRLTDGAGSIH